MGCLEKKEGETSFSLTPDEAVREIVNLVGSQVGGQISRDASKLYSRAEKLRFGKGKLFMKEALVIKTAALIMQNPPRRVRPEHTLATENK